MVQFVPVHGSLIGMILENPGNDIQVLSGRLGSGKTSILRHLDRSRDFAVRIRLEDFDPGHHGEKGDKASVGAVQGSFQQFERLLEELISSVGTNADLDELCEHVLEVRNSEVHNAKVDRIQDSFDELRFPLNPRDLADAWRAAARSVLAKFAELWNAETERPRCLLLLDNVDEISDQEMGVWLGELVPQLSGTTVVVTAKPAAEQEILASLHASANVTPIVRFDETTVRRWLDNAVGAGEVASSIAEKVYAVSDGHPATLALVHELLWRSGLSEDERERMLEQLPRQDAERVAALVERLVSRHADDLMARALQAAAIPRQFDASLLHHLLRDPQITTEANRSVFDRLANSSFVEDLSVDQSRLRVHPFVRRGLLERMFKYEPELFKDFNDRAARFYETEINRITDGKTGENYGDAFFYEKSKWQQNKREWLYHCCLASRDGEKHQAILEISQLFLDAFWWWGNYVHFDFCDQLVTDVARLVEVRRAPAGRPSRDLDIVLDDVPWPELGVLLKALRCILSDYPLRSVKPREAAWAGVRLAFLEIRSLCGRGVTLPGLKSRPHLEALLNVFLAHTWRYQSSPVIKTADDYYEKAEKLFEGDWSAPWVAFERADMLFQSGGDADIVNEHWARSAELLQSPDEVPDEPDEELTANLHRLKADLLWFEGRKEEAADAYGRAVLHAYVFHLVSDAPDEYTMQFYIDIRMRAVSWLFELSEQSGAGAAVPFASRMSTIGADSHEADEQLEELIREGKPLTLAHALFPRGPNASELGKSESDFRAEYLSNTELLDMGVICRDLLAR